MCKDNDPNDPVGKIIDRMPVFHEKKLGQAGNDSENINQAQAKEPKGQAFRHVETFVKEQPCQ